MMKFNLNTFKKTCKIENLPFFKVGFLSLFIILLFSQNTKAQEILHGDNIYIANGAKVYYATANDSGDYAKVTVLEGSNEANWIKDIEEKNERLANKAIKNNDADKESLKKSSEKKTLAKKQTPAKHYIINALNPGAQNHFGISSGNSREISAPQVLQILLGETVFYTLRTIKIDNQKISGYCFIYYGKSHSYSRFSRPPPSLVA